MNELPGCEVSDVEDAEETGPLRRCVVTGESLPKERLLRFVVSPEGAVVPDVKGSLPGRGIWLSARREAVETAAKKGLFARSARRAVKAPPDLAQKVAALLRADVIDALHLCKRSGVFVLGFEKVRDALQRGNVAVLLHARDAGDDGKEKLDRLAAARVWVTECLEREDLAQVAGRENAVHVVLRAGGATELFRRRAERFIGFMSETAL